MAATRKATKINCKNRVYHTDLDKYTADIMFFKIQSFMDLINRITKICMITDPYFVFI